MITKIILAICLVMLPLTVGCSKGPTLTSALPPAGPGTISFDSQGKVSGTGWEYYFYPGSKVTKATDAYVDGEPIYSAWFKPNGAKVAEQWWVNGCGVQYYLYDDGMVKSTIPMVGGVANGTATFFKPTGEVEKRVEYKNGKPTQD